MPRSQQPIGGEKIILDKILTIPNRRILDVGAGDGKWGGLLFEKVLRVDAIEIWLPYIKKHNLKEKYDTIFPVDLRYFLHYDLYQVIILGDVLEHLTQRDAINFVQELREKIKGVIYLTIPISVCEQDGEKLGNPYETHLYHWTHGEVLSLDFVLLHRGFNDNGLVEIGTYELASKYT